MPPRLVTGLLAGLLLAGVLAFLGAVTTVALVVAGPVGAVVSLAAVAAVVAVSGWSLHALARRSHAAH